jgi:hypothetical protein
MIIVNIWNVTLVAVGRWMSEFRRKVLHIYLEERGDVFLQNVENGQKDR